MLARRTVVALSSLLGAALSAQEAPPPQFAPQTLDSGQVDQTATVPMVHVGDIAVAGSAAVQLWFGIRQLQGDTQLKLTSLHDGAVQWFDRHSLADYGGVSAWFNGDRVRVELLPGAGTIGNRISVVKARFDAGAPAPELICGPTDTRVLSSDPRVGRLDGCCTTFLVDERNLVTAGHCIGGIGGQLVNFNVPLSTTAGVAQYPPPNDQYALRAGSLTSVSGGLGNDYAVMATVRNSNTGLYPGEAQGSWLPAVPGPTGGQPVTWTVTGYGTSSVNATWSLAQKSASGPRAAADALLLQFLISVTGCNSGSPVIGPAGVAHGVVTHAGCSGGGFNYGTGFAYLPLQQALANLQANSIAGTFAVFGQGCAGPSGTPALALSGTPDLGGSVTFTVTGTDPLADWPGLLFVGESDTTWNGAPLPQDLAFAGAPGCSLLVAPLLTFAQSSSFGSSAQTITVPNQPAFLGARFFAQHFAYDPAATNPAHAVGTNAGRLRIGN